MLSVVTFGGVFGHFGMRFPPLGSVKLWTKKTVAKIATEIEPYLSQSIRFYSLGALQMFVN